MLQLSRRAVLRNSLLYPYIRTGMHHISRRHNKPGLGLLANPSRNTQSCCSMAKPLTLVLLGDMMLGRLVDDSFTCDASRKTAAFGDVLPYLHSLDPATTIIAGNLECAVTSHSKPTPKAFNFKLSPANADILQQLRLRFVATANNHVLDYGQPGLKETNEVLTELGIQHAGSGTQPTASQPAVVTTTSGHRVAFLSYSDHYEDWAATKTTPGINFIDPSQFDPTLLQQQVAAARAVGPDLVVVLIHWGPNWRWQPDKHLSKLGSRFDPLLLQQQVAAARAAGPSLVVVLIHWGPNWRWQPDKHLRKLGRAFLDAGADLVFGTSPHHIQGVEVIGQKAIIYSGGSFVDDYAGDDHYRNDLSALMVAKFAPAPPAAAAPAAAAGSQQELDDRPARDQGSQQREQQRPSVPSGAIPGPLLASPAAAAADTEGEVSKQPVAAASGGSGIAAASQEPVSASLVLQTLHALPIVITHHWRTEGGPFSKEGLGNPPYFSQVDFATGDNWSWVANKLQQLSQALGNVDVNLLQGTNSISLFDLNYQQVV